MRRPSVSSCAKTSCARSGAAKDGILLRSNLPAQDPGKLWEMYLLLAEIEAAFKNLKSDLRLRPIYHELQERIEAHIFVAFLSLCLHVTLRGKLRPLAPGLTPRAVLDKLACIQMLDVYSRPPTARSCVSAVTPNPRKTRRCCWPR